MHSLAHYALLGSLVAAAAGALVLVIVTVQHGLKRRDAPDVDRAPEATAHRQRRIRLADTVAVLCFAVSAGLGVVGLMQQTRAVPAAMAATDDSQLVERIQALEKRLASTELELQARGGPAPEWRAWEERIARLETRLGAMEGRAAVAASPRSVAPAKTAPRPAAPAKPTPAPAPSASPRLAPSGSDGAAAPEAAAAPKSEVSAPMGTATALVVASREPARPRVEAPADDPSLGEKLRRDWDAIKRQARRGGDEWREGWDHLKRLFGH